MSQNCNPYFNCENADMGFEELIRRLVVINGDGCPALRMELAEQPKFAINMHATEAVNGARTAFTFPLPAGFSDTIQQYLAANSANGVQVFVDGLSKASLVSVVGNVITVAPAPVTSIIASLFVNA